MKGLLLILILAGAGYFGYNYYVDHKEEVDQRINAILKREQSAESGTDSSATAAATPAAPAAPTFESKIGAPSEPGEKQVAPPGIFYPIQRISKMTDSGVKAVPPGEKLTLVRRIGNGKMEVRSGTEYFEVLESQVTNDLNAAREAEKREFVARGGKL